MPRDINGELQEWLKSDVTKEFRHDITSHIEDLKEELAVSAGIDPAGDVARVSKIAMLRDLLDWIPEGASTSLEEGE